MRRGIAWIAVPAMLAGCDMVAGDPDPVATATATPAMTATPTPTGTTPAEAQGGARQVNEVTDTFVFDYSYPKEAGDIPGLARWLDSRLERERNRLAQQAARGQREARDNGFPFNKYSSGAEWKVIADLPDWLSLSAQIDSYSGGAHPNYGFDSIIWDKRENRPREPMSFFTSAEALDDALGDRLCDALDAERKERRGEQYDPAANDSPYDDAFSACVKADETNLLLGSSNGRTFDRIGIQIAPYLAGPYAEGTYEFTFDMTPELLDKVRPEFREAFTARN
ncbi:DUF4163 domain-containing protein [Aurantiacibacter spongiae]|nr:DUF4163 domain-containing protein [Aurantiacibacter spongiae]